MEADAGKQILIEGLQKSISAYERFKESDKAVNLHCDDKGCNVLPHIVNKTDRLDEGQNLILRWILIQEQAQGQKQPDMLSWGKDGLVVNGSRLSFLAGLLYIVAKLNGWVQ